jgi:hypothetical protein
MWSFLDRFKPKPEKRIIVHVGMHKTGTSSIQDTFYKRRNPDLEYIDWTNGNHCGLFVLLFEKMDKLGQYHGFGPRGPSFVDELPAMREEWLARLTAQLDLSRSRTLLFSAEDISAPRFDQPIQKMYDFFRGWTDDIIAVGYARAPRSFIVSAFQQNLKGGNIRAISQERLKPHYRKRFQKIEKTFGRDKVIIREFSRPKLINGDVVQDFAHTIGVSAPSPEETITSNQSLGLESASLLYVQRRYGKGFVSGFPTAQAANTDFFNRLTELDKRPLTFAEPMFERNLRNVDADVSWMEKRLGHAFSDPPPPPPDAIETPEDFAKIGLEQYEALQTLLGDAAKAGPATLDNLVVALETLREKCIEERSGQNEMPIG